MVVTVTVAGAGSEIWQELRVGLGLALKPNGTVSGAMAVAVALARARPWAGTQTGAEAAPGSSARAWLSLWLYRGPAATAGIRCWGWSCDWAG